MTNAYKIEIGVTPNSHENKTQPYYWNLYAYDGIWTNSAAGWASSPDKAWQEAYTFYLRYKSPKTAISNYTISSIVAPIRE